jgi:outer membrane receptor protein involved in Fe transport
LRGHQSGNSARPDSLFKNQYSQFFPTAYLSYKLDSAGRNSLNLSYSKRIRRPYYQDLNPFIFIQDKFFWLSGNPYLKPQFVQNIELSWNFKNRFTTSLMYNYATDLQKEVIEQRDDIFISRTGNIGRRIFMGISMNASLQPLKFWNSNIYTEIINNRDKGIIAANILRINTTYWFINANNQFNFAKGWAAELGGSYITNNTDGQFSKSFVWVISAGIQKKLLENKCTIRMNVNDVFETLEPRGTITNITGATATFHNYFDSRAITLTLSYSFGKNFKTSRRNSNGAEEEQNRIKN